MPRNRLSSTPEPLMRRTRRLAATAAAAGALASLVGLGLGTPHASAARFACEPDLQQACAVVFGPVCRKPFQNCY